MKTKYYEFLKSVADNAYKDINDLCLLSDKFDDFHCILDEDYNLDNSTDEEDIVMEHFDKFHYDIARLISDIDENVITIKEFNDYLKIVLPAELKQFS